MWLSGARLSELAHDNHFGILGMAERAHWAGGQLTFVSQPGEGTEVTVQIPLSASAQESDDTHPRHRRR